MYKYKEQRPWVFTDDGQRQFLRIRDRVNYLLREAGAVRLHEAIAKEVGHSFEMTACVDRMVELGELTELSDPVSRVLCRVFVGVTS